MVGADSAGSLPSPNVLRYQITNNQISHTRLSRSLVTYSTVFYYCHVGIYLTLQPQDKSWFGLLPFRSPLTKGISFDFFSSGYLDVSVLQLTYLPINRWYRMISHAGVSPFGHRRVTGLWLLTDDFRGLIRPSSAHYAKASTECFI